MHSLHIPEITKSFELSQLPTTYVHLTQLYKQRFPLKIFFPALFPMRLSCMTTPALFLDRVDFHALARADSRTRALLSCG